MKDDFALRAAEWDSPSKIKMTEIFVTEMLRHIKPEASWKALEIGAGTGLVGLQIAPMVDRIVFEDTSGAMLEVLQQKLNTNSRAEILNGEIYDYKKQDIDIIFSCMAFHHIPETLKPLNPYNI
jgi:predicted TPR repeat methyltransferase